MDEVSDSILVTGADGMVGSYVDFGVRTNRRILDVTDLREVMAVCLRYRPKVILHLAAETDVDRCERDPAYAYSVNSVGAYHITVGARAIGARVVYISTAGVFDGEKEGPYTISDKPNPRNYYGHSKYLGELSVLQNSDHPLVVRACWMMGGGPHRDQKFVAKIVAQVRDPKVKEIKAITDQLGAPTFGKDLIVEVRRLIQEGRVGVVHLSNTGVASRFDVAKEIVQELRPELPVVPVDSKSFLLDAKRTKNEMLEVETGYMRPWQNALREYLKTEWNS